ncbi:MAG: YbjQ family protein [Candidatus Vecturithrix sp.]|jgi:uncharacterized protein YbjQ (UPF0145 family)|nr:YbjQ family protein [Candidatus Vecturithrix sp.]
MELIIFLSLIVIGYVSGRIIETKHYRSIETREQEFLSLPAVSLKHALDMTKEVARVKLVSGSVVVSIDYFKRFLAGLRNFFGGRVKSYETLIDRARREAILRMKAEAKGADIILNMRLETASISKGARKTIGSVEVLAYGTAVTYKRGTAPIEISQDQPSAAMPVVGQAAAKEPRYKVVFSGELAAGQDLQKVKTRVAALYKVPVERCDHLFSGRTMTIKDDLDYQTAQKYQRLFEQTGAVCYIEPM